MGWASVATIVRDGASFRVLRTDRLETAGADDIEAQGPYHRAAGFQGAKRIPVPIDPPAVVDRGRLRQRRHTLASFSALARELERSGYAIAAGAILAGRGVIARSLEAVLASHAQIHVAEGIAVRDAVEQALRSLGIASVRLDRETVLGEAARLLRCGEAELEARVRATRPENGGRWRREERLAALAARLALDALGTSRMSRGQRGGAEA
jgi:hypothetical protein